MKMPLKNIVKYIIATVLISGMLLSFPLDFESGIATGRHFRNFVLEIVAFLPLMFILIGLIDAWLPRSVIEKHVGGGSGFLGSVWVILLAMLQAGPLYGAFPVAQILWEKGCSIRNIFIYLGAFVTMKIPMISFEIGFLGWRFSLLRTLITLPVFIVIAYGMEKIIGKSGLPALEKIEPGRQ